MSSLDAEKKELDAIRQKVSGLARKAAADGYEDDAGDLFDVARSLRRAAEKLTELGY
jgi:hypothetical protein